MMNQPLVVVAMSGGVDSSVAAGLLVEKGYRVIGMMLRLWSEAGQEEQNKCCTPDSVAQARRVCAILDIPFYVIDAQEIFRSIVVEAFLDGYRSGETPNPCVVCNRFIRWEYLLEQAKSIGAEKMATGHYARVEEKGGHHFLRKGVDGQKDQSYVLSRLTQSQLAYSLFPLGDLTKPEVRAHARRLGLPVAERAESQDLCFLADGDYRSFLRRYSPETSQPGHIVNVQGEVIGTHDGLAFYTIGQRKGIGIAAAEPMYVIRKDYRLNQLVVGYKRELGSHRFRVVDLNWIGKEKPRGSVRADVKIRYKALPVEAIVEPEEDGTALVTTDKMLRDITPGQLAVFYQDDIVIGSGFIRALEEG